MKLRYQFIIYISIVHIALLVLTYYLIKHDLLYFFIAEIAIVLSFIIGCLIYRSMIRPLNLMKTGIHALKDEDYTVKFIETKSPETNELIKVFNRMLDRLRTESLQSQEQAYLLENVIQASPTGIIILDFDDYISDINHQASQYIQYSKNDTPKPLSEWDNLIARELASILVGESKVISTNGVLKYKCQVNSVIHKGFKRKFVMIEELSKELLQNEKASYGKVIRMMAHEVNNSMAAVNSILQSVMEFGFENSDEDKEFIESLQIAYERNQELGAFMNNFANVIKIPIPVLMMRDLGETVNRSISLVAYMAESQQIEINVVRPDHPVAIMHDAALLQQVLINMIKNSVESIGTSGGVIRIKVQHEIPQLQVIDNGAGIDEASQAKLFTPFYSSKATGQGIGLIVIREILIQHHASFVLYTDKADGLTKFEVTFTS